jgi:parvulin-like peptidyl-prolyl isomerase
VYLNPERHGANAARDASSLLARLKQRAEADISQLGDSFLLGQDFQSVRTSEISKQFGEQFVSKLRELPVGSWEGPIESGYGLHLVQVTARNAGQTPSFKDVRESVQREWSNAQREEINEKFYQELLKRYTVTIEAPLFAKTQ